MPKILMRAEQTRAYIGNVGESKFDQMVRDKQFIPPTLCIGRIRMWDQDAIDRWIKEQAAAYAAAHPANTICNAR